MSPSSLRTPSATQQPHIRPSAPDCDGLGTGTRNPKASLMGMKNADHLTAGTGAAESRIHLNKSPTAQTSCLNLLKTILKILL